MDSELKGSKFKNDELQKTVNQMKEEMEEKNKAMELVM